MKGVNNKSKRLLCVMLAAIMVFAVFTAGIGIVPAGADPGPTRSVVPDSVAPGGEVNVTIEFTTLWKFSYLFIRDYVPLGWDVRDMRVNEDANETLFLTEFNATTGIVLFFWMPIASGIPVTAEYTLHVPHDAEQGVYPLAGELVGRSEDTGSWNDTIHEGTVMVETNVPPTMSDPSADPEVIPDDTDNDPLWGESSTLNVTVTDDSGIMSVMVDLSAIGGSATQPMTNIGGNIWSVPTNASNGVAGWTGTAYEPYQLQVNATDEKGMSNTSVSIPLTVMKNGDVDSSGDVKVLDVIYLVNHLATVPGYEEIIPEIADVDGNGEVKVPDVIYLVNHLATVPGYEKLH